MADMDSPPTARQIDREEARSFGRQILRERASSFADGGYHETAAMLRYAADDLEEVSDLARKREQTDFLYDQWGLRIFTCERREPHRWHGWTSWNEDLRCPGVAG